MSSKGVFNTLIPFHACVTSKHDPPLIFLSLLPAQHVFCSEPNAGITSFTWNFQSNLYAVCSRQSADCVAQKIQSEEVAPLFHELGIVHLTEVCSSRCTSQATSLFTGQSHRTISVPLSYFLSLLLRCSIIFSCSLPLLTTCSWDPDGRPMSVSIAVWYPIPKFLVIQGHRKVLKLLFQKISVGDQDRTQAFAHHY